MTEEVLQKKGRGSRTARQLIHLHSGRWHNVGVAFLDAVTVLTFGPRNRLGCHACGMLRLIDKSGTASMEPSVPGRVQRVLFVASPSY